MRGLSGSALKMTAIITMLIDHIGAVVLARLLISGQGNTWIYQLYFVLRTIGRIAFPIFCFLLVEGFKHTGNHKKYALRLFVFALISEIPFDLALSSSILELEYQNVFFTLFIGLLTISGFHVVQEKVEWTPFKRAAVLSVLLFAGMGAAQLLHTDYGAKGVMCIVALYIFRKIPGMQILAGCIAFGWWELDSSEE